MGNENSAMVDSDTPPKTLEARSVDAVAKYIHEKKARRIVVMAGAGISTSAGIPDFRSPDTGIYSTLARLDDLPHPEAVFDISYFRRNPQPFYTLARELLPGRFRPTIAHCFIRLLYDKGRLLKLFTQNIDCLEREAGVPPEMVVEAHGSFASHRCIDCQAPYPDDRMRRDIEAGDVPPRCAECDGVIKPDVIFFGEALPSSFFLNRTLPAAADLCIVMGTSLTVQPFASLPGMCAAETPRLLLNLQRAGGLGSRADDVLLLGECDDGVRQLADALGWRDELEALCAQTAPAPAKEGEAAEKEETAAARDERLRDEVEQLTKEVDQTLHVSQNHEQKVRDQLQPQHGAERESRDKESDDNKKPDKPDSGVPQPSAQEGDTRGESKSTASTTEPTTVEKKEGDLSEEAQATGDRPADSTDDRQSKKAPSTL